MIKRVIDTDYLISYMKYAINSCHYEKTLIEDNLTIADVIEALIKDIDKMADVLYKPANNKEMPTIEAISKDQYEARLKADVVDMLTDLQLEIGEVPKYCMTHDCICVYRRAEEYMSDVNNVIQQKIDKLKEVEK